MTFEGVTLDEVSLHIGAANISRIRCLNKSRNLIFIRVMMSYIRRKQVVRSLFEPYFHARTRFYVNVVYSKDI